MLNVVRKMSSESAKASSKDWRYFERKSSATRMRDRPVSNTEITRENKVFKDYWIDCRHLEQFEHMKWSIVKKDLSKWLIQQEAVHISTNNQNRTIVATE